MGLFDFLKKGKQADSQSSGPDALIDLGMTADERKSLAKAIHDAGVSMGRSMPDVEKAVLSGKKVPARLLTLCQTAIEANMMQCMMTGRSASREQAELHSRLQKLLGGK